MPMERKPGSTRTGAPVLQRKKLTDDDILHSIFEQVDCTQVWTWAATLNSSSTQKNVCQLNFQLRTLVYKERCKPYTRALFSLRTQVGWTAGSHAGQRAKTCSVRPGLGGPNPGQDLVELSC
ncbi:unnamed protein product [Orchesella dallaii]|uniref:Uncharacterized protein n=1 Tax=Orchesella dallaii TaxID=48710 RepID=A0ABP1RJL9_9HEXA